MSSSIWPAAVSTAATRLPTEGRSSTLGSSRRRPSARRSRAASIRHVWLQSSTATIYAHRWDAPNDEPTGVFGGDEVGVPETWRFSIEVARAWEQALEEADTPRTRKVALRTAIVMSPDRGGAFDTLLGLVRRGLGGTSGNGRQYVSWIHHEDFTRAIAWLVENEVSGAVISPRPGRSRTQTSCGIFAVPGEFGSAYPPRGGCSRWALGS